MKLMNIKPIVVEIPFLEELLCSYLNYVGIDYQKMLFLSWGFSINPEDPMYPGRIGNRIDFDKGDYLNLMEKYCGYKLSHLTSECNNTLVHHISDELNQRRAVIALCDSSSLPYHRTYGKKEESHTHNVLVIGFSDTEIFVMDPGWIEGPYAIKINQFEKALLKKIDVFEKINTFEQLDLATALTLIINKVLTPRDGHDSMFSAIIFFAELMKDQFDIKSETDAREYSNETLKWLPLFTNMTRIDGQRAAMSYVFKYFSQIFSNENCLEIADKFLFCVKQWAYVRYGIFRAIIANRKDAFLKSVNNLYMIAEYERNILEEMQKIRDGLTQNELSDSSMVLLDLREYFNENFFGYAGSLNSDSYIISNSVPNGSIIDCGNSKFIFPQTTMQCNIISCAGQNIQTQIDFYSGAAILGFSVFAGYVGDLIFTYEDGSQDESVLALNDFMEPQPRFGEKIALKCEIYRNQMTRNGLIFYEVYSIDSSKKLQSISLPDWPKLYILSITLKK
jgi:hypothetical protein